jgi:hypothetical protein
MHSCNKVLAMKLSVTRFKSLKVCLKELMRFILNGEHLQTGRPIVRFGNLRSREILDNWLLCVIINFENKFNQVTLCTDTDGGDGIIYDSIEKKAFRTEHIMVPRDGKGTEDIESLILRAIDKKQAKGGVAYAAGKTLVVFSNATGNKWHPNKSAKKLPKAQYFDSIWVFALQGVVKNEYIYSVTRLNSGDSPIWRVCINENFSNWQVRRIQ